MYLFPTHMIIFAIFFLNHHIFPPKSAVHLKKCHPPFSARNGWTRCKKRERIQRRFSRGALGITRWRGLTGAITAGNGWVAGGCWDDYFHWSYGSFSHFLLSTSKWLVGSKSPSNCLAVRISLTLKMGDSPRWSILRGNPWFHTIWMVGVLQTSLGPDQKIPLWWFPQFQLALQTHSNLDIHHKSVW